ITTGRSVAARCRFDRPSLECHGRSGWVGSRSPRQSEWEVTMAVVALALCPDGRCRPKLVDGGNPSPSRNSPEISAAVGANAANRMADVRVIQDALNQVPERSGGPEPPLKVDGLCYGKTQAAIKR